MSAESMSVLLSAIAIFELFMSEWEALYKDFPRLRPWINVSLKWAKRYYNLMDDTGVYIVTMGEFLNPIFWWIDDISSPVVLNPCIHFRWIKDQWESAFIKYARTTILNIVSTCW